MREGCHTRYRVDSRTNRVYSVYIQQDEKGGRNGGYKRVERERERGRRIRDKSQGLYDIYMYV